MLDTTYQVMTEAFIGGKLEKVSQPLRPRKLPTLQAVRHYENRRRDSVPFQNRERIFVVVTKAVVKGQDN